MTLAYVKTISPGGASQSVAMEPPPNVVLEPHVATCASASSTAAIPAGGRENPSVVGSTTVVAVPSLLNPPEVVGAAGTSDTPRVADGSINISLPIGTLMIAPGMVFVRL